MRATCRQSLRQFSGLFMDSATMACAELCVTALLAAFATGRSRLIAGRGASRCPCSPVGGNIVHLGSGPDGRS